MKFFHLSDLHFGKMLYGIDFIEKDQPQWVEQFLKKTDEYSPEAVVISGDIYDKRNPSPEAIKLFEYLITGLERRKIAVFIIPGNHDSEIRLSYASEILKNHNIYIASTLQKEMMHITFKEVTFWLMPYITPIQVRECLKKDEINSYNEAAKALIDAQNIDENHCNVLIAHQNVLNGSEKPEHSDSETIIGGLGEIQCNVFNKFDYVALGHIHNCQKIGRETIRYAGCPLYYDFSEVNRKKNLTLVTVEDKTVKIDSIEIPLLHRMKRIEGSFEELKDKGLKLSKEEKEGNFFEVVFTDGNIPNKAKESLDSIYGENLIHIQRKIFKPENSTEQKNSLGIENQKSLKEHFEKFYNNYSNEKVLDDIQEKTLTKLLEQQSLAPQHYTDVKDIPTKETDAFIEELLRLTAEEKEQ